MHTASLLKIAPDDNPQADYRQTSADYAAKAYA